MNMLGEQEILFDNKLKKYYTNESILRGILRHTSFIASGNKFDTLDGPNSPSKGANGPWWDCVCQMGAWYQHNIHTYQGTVGTEPLKGKKFYNCDLIGTKVADDCSGFVKACLQMFGIAEVNSIWVTTAAMQPGSKFDDVLRSSGFTYMSYSKDIVQPGDIMCGGPSTHTEIYAGDGKSYSWGNIHDGIHARKCKSPQGMPCYTCKMNYKHIWRYI